MSDTSNIELCLSIACAKFGLTQDQIKSYIDSFKNDWRKCPEGEPKNQQEAIAKTGVILAYHLINGEVEIAKAEGLDPEKWQWKAS